MVKALIERSFLLDTLKRQYWLSVDKGSISHKQAIEKAEHEFAIYRKREMEQLESDFDKMIKNLPKQ